MVHALTSKHVYAMYSQMSPAGFTPNFASLTGAWGVGIYYSSKPQLAMQFGHSLKHSDLAFNAHLAGLGRSERQGLKQVLAVDVLTGKSTHLSQNRALRMPPKIEDTRLAEYVPLNATDMPSASCLLHLDWIIPDQPQIWILLRYISSMLQPSCQHMKYPCSMSALLVLQHLV